jgi:thiol-disulfide isomerase/thioredoxin
MPDPQSFSMRHDAPLSRASRAMLVGLLLALGRPLAAQQDEIGLPLGAVPPPATVEDLEGRPVGLGDFVGRRPVLLEFWATWCPLCEALMPRLRAAHARYGDRVEFIVVGVGVNQTRRTMQRHLERHPAPFRHVFDARGAAVRAYQAPSTSYVVILDARGRVVYTGVGEDQDIEAAVRRALEAT